MFPHAALRFRTAPRRAALTLTALLAVGVLLGGPAPAPAQTEKNVSALLNLQHTLLVRKAFLKDNELAPLNLGVQVENHIATLWGPVPSAKLLAKAVKTAKSVPDILEVHSYLYLDLFEVPEPQYLPAPGSALAAPPGKHGAPDPPPESPVAPSVVQTVATETTKTTSITQGIGNWQPAITEKTSSFKAAEVPGATEDPGLFVFPPITVAAAPGDTVSAGVPLAVALKDRVLQLQAADPRYKQVQVQVEDNRVYLSGVVANYSDVQQLAKAIAQLSGVDSVIIGQVQVKALK
jgi:hypothetical protein